MEMTQACIVAESTNACEAMLLEYNQPIEQLSHVKAMLMFIFD
jgi:hypothetical protein